jgi:hypothetical protein
MIAHGRYLDHYEKRGGIWKFLRRSLVLDWVAEHAVPTQIEVVGSRLGIAIGR